MTQLLSLALVAALFCLCVQTTAQAAPERATLKAPPAEVVQLAIKSPNFKYGRANRGGAHTNGAWGSGSMLTLAVASYAGEKAADAKLLEQIRFVLQGENSLSANGGYPAQHERLYTAAVVLAKFTPRIWDQFTPDEKKKLDLLQKAALVGSAYTTSDRSYAGGRAVTAIDGDTNMNRGWNPNFQEGMVGGMLVGAVYFGPAEAQKMLDTYDHAAFVAELKAAGLTNTWETFNWKTANPSSAAPAPADIERCVRGYRYLNLDLSDPMAFYVLLTERTYSAKVHAGLNNGAGINGSGKIAKGADGVANLGKDGMLMEFNSRDANGARSSAGYAYHGFRPNLANQIVLVAGGYWKKGDAAARCLSLMEVGIPDLFYKLEQGYLDYSKGKGSNRPFTIDAQGWDFAMTRSLWFDVMKPWHEANR